MTIARGLQKNWFAEELLQKEEETQVENASVLAMGDLSTASAKEFFAHEQKLLEQMAQVAEEARTLPDARVRELISWIRKNMCPDLGKSGARWNNTRVIIFTEYDDTKRYLREQLEGAIEGTDLAEHRIEIFHGPTPPAKRDEIKKAFNADPQKQPVRILIATDAAREGLNLQAQCWNLFHFDVPWNPGRMEQRNGRIDRKLQSNPEVFCHYFVYAQRPEDRILEVLVRKTETIRKELGSLSHVIDAKLAEALRRGGIRRSQILEQESEIQGIDLEDVRKKAVVEELESARARQNELRKQIDNNRTLLEKSQKSIGLEEAQFRAAISSALQLSGAKPLREESGDGRSRRFSFPSLDQQRGGDPRWAETLDTLRAPRKRDEKWWDWRKDSPIRPVVFEDPGTMDEEVVHLHLEQRVVQRLLSQFTCQGFVLHDLSRACLAQSNDAIARVILLGRLSLYGPAAARLHEEIIAIAARWSDPAIRKQPLSPFAREAEDKTLRLLDESLLKQPAKIEAKILAQLQVSAPRDVTELLPHLESRGHEFGADAEKKLKARAEAESKAMREILETQQRNLSSKIKKHSREDQQFLLDLGFSNEEAKQMQLNRQHWEKRLQQLGNELTAEPKRVAELYEIKARRIEPVGLVYLWPVTS
jgi:hypothetical protein